MLSNTRFSFPSFYRFWRFQHIKNVNFAFFNTTRPLSLSSNFGTAFITLAHSLSNVFAYETWVIFGIFWGYCWHSWTFEHACLILLYFICKMHMFCIESAEHWCSIFQVQQPQSFSSSSFSRWIWMLKICHFYTCLMLFMFLLMRIEELHLQPRSPRWSTSGCLVVPIAFTFVQIAIEYYN